MFNLLNKSTLNIFPAPWFLATFQLSECRKQLGRGLRVQVQVWWGVVQSGVGAGSAGASVCVLCCSAT